MRVQRWSVGEQRGSIREQKGGRVHIDEMGFSGGAKRWHLTKVPHVVSQRSCTILGLGKLPISLLYRRFLIG